MVIQESSRNSLIFDNSQIYNVYRGKTVLVTGHTGFKGSWLSIWLKSLGARVVGYALEPNTQPSNFEETTLEKKITSNIGDVRDEKNLTDVLQQHAPEFVFHLAAQPIVRLSYVDPKLTYETNVMGLVNLLEAVRKIDSVRVVINITSDKCYENREWVWGYRESDPMGGYDPYSSSKACSEIITASYRRSFFNSDTNPANSTALASVRAGNVIGGGDWALNRIVPDCIRSLVERKTIDIRNPLAIRPWQHVIEPLSGYLWLGVLLKIYGDDYASAWNFGPKNDQPVTVEDLVGLLINFWGEGSWMASSDAQKHEHEAHYLKLDCSKAHRLLKWQALLDVDEAIAKTVDWYKSFYQRSANVHDVCLEQIKEYVTLAKQKGVIWSSWM